VSRSCKARRLGLETVLPEARPRKRIPVRRATLALIENRAGEILLERRPPAGIWGGLWSLPECPAGSDAVDWIRQRFGWSVRDVEAAPGFRHTFTHFHLDIAPLRIRLGAVDGVADSVGLVWRRPGGELDLGVAAPIRKLIEGHTERHSGRASEAPETRNPATLEVTKDFQI
jgi:A/G-specific adenine glycosylase